MFDTFQPTEAMLPELHSIHKLLVPQSKELDVMIQDRHELESVVQYMKKQLRKSHKQALCCVQQDVWSTLEEIEDSMKQMATFWEEYDNGPKILAVKYVRYFKMKYGNDANYNRLYEAKFVEAHNQLDYLEKDFDMDEDDRLMMLVQQELTSGYCKHYKRSKYRELERL